MFPFPFFYQHNFFFGLYDDYYYYDAFSVYLVQLSSSSPLLCSYYHIEKYISFLLEFCIKSAKIIEVF